MYQKFSQLFLHNRIRLGKVSSRQSRVCSLVFFAFFRVQILQNFGVIFWRRPGTCKSNYKISRCKLLSYYTKEWNILKKNLITVNYAIKNTNLQVIFFEVTFFFFFVFFEGKVLLPQVIWDVIKWHLNKVLCLDHPEI